MGDMVIAVPLATLLFAFLGSISLVVGFSRTERSLDLSRQKEREITETNAMLERMHVLKNEYMQNISHEIATPLTVISGYAQLTGWQLEQNAFDSETAQNLKTISREAQRLANIASRLLDITDKEQSATEKRKIGTDELLAKAAAVCRPILEKNRNTLRIETICAPPVFAHEETLLQVLINLAINANNHTRNGSVVFSASADEEDASMAVFRVSDTGGGILPRDVAYVFDKGFSPGGGKGLGLHISREIVEAAGGRIAIERTGAEGTVFRFTIPRWKEA
jgi:signal transduction histidine kinase